MESGNTQPRVGILMSSYNGERFLPMLMDSLLRQDYPNVVIHVRDDGSTDGTPAILGGYAAQYSQVKLKLGINLGCARSFLELLRDVDADIYMFCDQDDIWLPGKVSSAVAAISRAGWDKPILYHTDLTVVDQDLRTIHPSFMAHQGLSLPAGHDLRVLAIQNCVVGCTVAMTSALVHASGLVRAVPDKVAMHDWWLALYARCRGVLVYSPKSEILYRQHGHNVSGAKRRSPVERLLLQLSRSGLDRINSYRMRISQQARAFLDYYGDELDGEQRRVLLRVAGVHPDAGAFPVLRCLLGGIRFQNLYMNLVFAYTAAATRLAALVDRGRDAERIR